jgi:hypothetical protein
MATVSRYGLTDRNMKVNGNKTRLTARVNSFMLMEMFMRASGRMIRLMAMVLILTPMGQLISESGKTISSMVKELRHGPTVPSMKANILKGKSMAREL